MRRTTSGIPDFTPCGYLPEAATCGAGALYCQGGLNRQSGALRRLSARKLPIGGSAFQPSKGLSRKNVASGSGPLADARGSATASEPRLRFRAATERSGWKGAFMRPGERSHRQIPVTPSAQAGLRRSGASAARPASAPAMFDVQAVRARARQPARQRAGSECILKVDTNAERIQDLKMGK